MKKKNKKFIYLSALKKWGLESQMLLAAEECNELIAELLRQFRCNRQNVSGLLEEMADVDIMLGQLRIIFAEYDNEFSKIKQRKLKNVEELLDGGKRGRGEHCEQG